MKITNVSAHIMGVPGHGGHSPSRNWVFVRIDTDEHLIGVGEATTEHHEYAVAAMVEKHFASMLIGQDPTRISAAWQQMQRTFWWRNGVVASSAASGIEQALWDITGKAYGQPVYKLLGGAVRDRVRVYARSDLGLASHALELRAALDEGFTAFKFGPGALTNPFNDVDQVGVALRLAGELRETAGAECDLMLDCGGFFSRASAFSLIESLQPLRPLFVEEPVNMDTPDTLRELRAAFPGVKIAAGERQMTRWGFREWLDTHTVDVIQADLCHCGGIGELIRIAAFAEVSNVLVAPHNPYGPVALGANVHACATIPNFLILEHCRHRPWSDDVVKAGITIRNGSAELPDRPGLGVELNWDYIKQHPYQPLSRRAPRDAYGALPLI